VSKFEVHTSLKVVMMYWNLKDWHELYRWNFKRERCVSNCESCMDVVYWNYLILCHYNRQIYVFISFLKKLTKFWYYCYYYVLIWRKKVWIVPRRQFNFSSISRKWTIIGNMSVVVFFYNFSYLIICTCSSIWNYDNKVEIHLTYRE
jgi:hypothetical protein